MHYGLSNTDISMQKSHNRQKVRNNLHKIWIFIIWHSSSAFSKQTTVSQNAKLINAICLTSDQQIHKWELSGVDLRCEISLVHSDCNNWNSSYEGAGKKKCHLAKLHLRRLQSPFFLTILHTTMMWEQGLLALLLATFLLDKLDSSLMQCWTASVMNTVYWKLVVPFKLQTTLCKMCSNAYMQHLNSL